MNYDAVTFLFPGEAEDKEESILLSDQKIRKNLAAKVLKVPHHGSDTSSSEEFLKAVSPQWMVISAGKKNVGTNTVYLHPRLSTINRLLEFAGAHTNSRFIDVYDSAKKVLAKIDLGKSRSDGKGRRDRAFL